jgi:hypothetical protein
MASDGSHSLVNLSMAHKFAAVAPDAGLLSVIQMMKDGASRVLVIDPPSGKLTNIVSQSDIITIFNKNKKELFSAEELSKKIAHMSLGVKMTNLVYCLYSDSTLSAICKMVIAPLVYKCYSIYLDLMLCILPLLNIILIMYIYT